MKRIMCAAALLAALTTGTRSFAQVQQTSYQSQQYYSQGKGKSSSQGYSNPSQGYSNSSQGAKSGSTKHCTHCG